MENIQIFQLVRFTIEFARKYHYENFYFVCTIVLKRYYKTLGEMKFRSYYCQKLGGG